MNSFLVLKVWFQMIVRFRSGMTAAVHGELAFLLHQAQPRTQNGSLHRISGGVTVLPPPLVWHESRCPRKIPVLCREAVLL